MKDLWCIETKIAGLTSAVTKSCDYTTEKNILLFLIYPLGK